MITIGALAERADLGLRFLGGDRGRERIVTWAHAVDLPDPWRWVGDGDLVMTTGTGLPAAPHDQRAWVADLIGAGPSGLVVAAAPGTPSLSSAGIEVAERHGFPVLTASFDLSFSRLARIVIESALDSQRHRLANSERLFAAYVDSLRDGGSTQDRLGRLGRRLGWHLRLSDGEPGRDAGSSAGASDPDAVTAILPGPRRVSLAARPRDARRVDDVVDPMLLHYLAGLLSVDLERSALDRDRERVSGATLLREALSGDIEDRPLLRELSRRGLAEAVVLSVAPSGSAPWRPDDVHHAPLLRATGMVILDLDDEVLLVAPPEDDLIEGIRSSLGADSVVGVSRPLSTGLGVADAVAQARLARLRAERSGARRLSYGTDGMGVLGTDTIGGAMSLALRHLGPLLDYDRERGTDLVSTIAAFLTEDGSWQRTAERLHIHRQTLAHRLRTIEHLTGLKPATTVGTATLWLALQAGEATGVISLDDPPGQR